MLLLWLAVKLLHHGFFLFPFLPVDGIGQIHQRNGLPGPGLLLQLSHGRLFGAVVDNAVDHPIVIFHGHLCGLQVVLRALKRGQLPETPEHGLDEYPLPNEDLTAADLENCGYLDGDMLPISKEQAREFLDNGFSVYSIFDGGGASMCFDQDDIDVAPAALPFAIPREEWEDSREFENRVHERMNQQEAREAAFLSHDGDCFAIYQLKQDQELRDIRYEGLDWLKSIGRSVERENYDLVYTAPLQNFPGPEAALENLWYRFNNEHPADYRHPSMSVSDIVAVKQNDRDKIGRAHV